MNIKTQGVSYEFNDEIGVKLVCLLANVDWDRALTNNLTEQDWAKLTRAFGKVAQGSTDRGKTYWKNLYDLIYKNSLGEQNAIN